VKHAFSTLAAPDWSLTQFLDAAVRYGYDGIDLRGIGSQIDVTRLPEFNENIDPTLHQFSQRNLLIAGLSTSARCSVEKEKRQEHLDEVQRYANLAAKIVLSANVGRPIIRVFGGKIPDGMSFDQALTEAADQLRRYGDIAAKRGDMVAVETHDDWCASDRVRALIEKADHPAVGAIWDVHHPWRTTGESPQQTWDRIGIYVQYIHLKDAKGKVGGDQQLCPTGEGNVPIRETLEVLKTHNYDGWLTFEWEKRWHPELPDADKALSGHIAYVKKWL